MAQTEAEVARKTETIMAQADKDGDGVVTFDGKKPQQQNYMLFLEDSCSRLTPDFGA